MNGGEYEVFVFDLYGTLVDIRTNEGKPYLWKKISELYSSMGARYSPAEIKKSYRRKVDQAFQKVQETGEEIYGEVFSGEPDLTEVFRELFLEKGIDCSPETAAMTANYFRILSRQKLEVYRGVKKTLQRLRDGGKRVYLLSNAQKDFTRPELELLGLTDCFDGILISSEEGCKKPSPIFFNRLFERYELAPDRCLMVGNDMNSDIAGGAAMGMDTLYLHTEISPPLTGKPEATYTVLDGDWDKVAEILLTAAGLI